MISSIRKFLHDEQGLAAVEVAMIMPALVSLMLGMVDIGNELLVNRKTVIAAQIVADLVTRHGTVTNAELDDAWAAAKMAIQPFNTVNTGLDIASVQFQGSSASPTVIWRNTYNMTPNANAATLAAGLGVQNEGVVVITARYVYTPVFTAFLTGGARTVQETAVARPRRGSYLAKG